MPDRQKASTGPGAASPSPKGAATPKIATPSTVNVVVSNTSSACRPGVRNVAAITSEEVVAYVQQVALAMVEITPPGGAQRTRVKGRV